MKPKALKLTLRSNKYNIHNSGELNQLNLNLMPDINKNKYFSPISPQISTKKQEHSVMKLNINEKIIRKTKYSIDCKKPRDYNYKADICM